MEKLIIRELTVSDQGAFFRAAKAFPNEPAFEFISTNLFDSTKLSNRSQEDLTATYRDILKTLNDHKAGRNLPVGFVPSTALFAFNASAEIVGRISIRHSLNDYLLQVGGHIGYGVLPSYRRKGFATLLLKEALSYCQKQLGLDRLLLTCDDDNIGSIRVIEKCNGILENIIDVIIGTSGSKKRKRRYWIELNSN